MLIFVYYLPGAPAGERRVWIWSGRSDKLLSVPHSGENWIFSNKVFSLLISLSQGDSRVNMRTARLRLHDLSSARSLFHPTIFLHIVSSYYLPMYSCHSHLAWFADPGQPQVNPILRQLDLISHRITPINWEISSCGCACVQSKSGITFITFHPSAWHIANVSLTWSPNAARPENMPRPNLRSSNLIAPHFNFFWRPLFSTFLLNWVCSKNKLDMLNFSFYHPLPFEKNCCTLISAYTIYIAAVKGLA